MTADSVVGRPNASAWNAAYRILNHSAVNSARNSALVATLPPAALEFTRVLSDMLKKRHEADYSGSYRLSKSEVLDIEQAELTLENVATLTKPEQRVLVTAFLASKRRT